MKLFFYVSVLFQVACATIELPVSYGIQGEWQRPIDLRLHEKEEVESEPETSFEASSETISESQKNVKEEIDNNNTEGSLHGLKVQVICGEWQTDVNHIRIENDSACRSLEKKLLKYDALVLDAEESVDGNPVAPDLIVRFLRGPMQSVGCGFYGWISYMTFWMIPCKGYEWGDARLQFLSPDGLVLEQFPLSFQRRTIFGWSALMAGDLEHQSKYDSKIQLVNYMINRTYTFAVKKKMIVVSR